MVTRFSIWIWERLRWVRRFRSRSMGSSTWPSRLDWRLLLARAVALRHVRRTCLYWGSTGRRLYPARTKKEHKKHKKHKREIPSCAFCASCVPSLLVDLDLCCLITDHLDPFLEQRGAGRISQGDVMIAGRQVEFLQFSGESGEHTVNVHRRVFHTRLKFDLSGVRACDIRRSPPRVITIPVPSRTP